MTTIKFNPIIRNTILPGTTKTGQRIKTSVTMKEIGEALVDGVCYVSNGTTTVGYPLSVAAILIDKDMTETDKVHLYLTEEGATIKPYEEEKKPADTSTTDGFRMTKEEYDQLKADGMRIFDEIFGDLFSQIDKFGI